jgi:hypothetical protein
MSLYDLFLGGLETKQSNSLHHTLGKMVLGYIDAYEQIKAGYYDGSIVDNNKAMRGAALGGHKDLIELFINLGANDLNRGMGGAAEGGHKDLVDWFRQKINL